MSLGEDIGLALVPYYRQLLPVMAIFVNQRDNLGDRIDYHQRIGHVGELVQVRGLRDGCVRACAAASKHELEAYVAVSGHILGSWIMILQFQVHVLACQ